MLVLYPSNKLEHLSYLLGELLSRQPGDPFSPETILVESPGMQHWLNMQLARQQGIAMNLQFPLPTRFMWDTARALLGPDSVPRKSSYRREVLIWRIEGILRSSRFQTFQQSRKVCQYWNALQDEEARSAQRLQLAAALADVFEQYLLYRPHWLFAWENNESAIGEQGDEEWQALIWRLLVEQQPLHPARLHKLSVEALQQHGPKGLPNRVIVFAINALAPQVVQFFDALARHIDIHLFHLNPSVNYWGDSKSDRELALTLRTHGIEQFVAEQQANPLLGNLGKQGRELFNQLTELQSYEISAFDSAEFEEPDEPLNRLHALQNDILHACAPSAGFMAKGTDNSILITRAHSALREVQGLHDALLQMMQDDPDIHPSDVVVMCPAIEEYAPLVDAVFHRIGTPRPEHAVPPRIPCSIADRAPMDSEPLVAAFISLLSLPDSRFEVSKILDYLRLEATQSRFSLTSDDLLLMTDWLQKAHVHWGRNAEHKANITDGAATSAMHSWAWGLKRLLVGMVYEDSAVLADDLLTVPDVEGQNTVVLGKLIDLVEQLGRFAERLKTPRSAAQWHEFLIELRDACFAPQPDALDSWESIARATADLAAHCEEAGFDETLSLRQVRDVLIKRFSSPDAGNHFMTGQVTFCSMLPMRSIPFKVVCILGLNDGEFPRQSQPISIDLMARTARLRGDRSRRLEDRYLFLEALISARQRLYLSYQANSAQDNSPRQPSLVLAELLNVIGQGYDGEHLSQRQLGLHPFSTGCFSGPLPSFERGWHRLAEAIQGQQEQLDSRIEPVSEVKLAEELKVSEFSRAFRSPLEYFANQTLGVYLQQSAPLLQDAEPFTENALTRYQALDSLALNAAAQQPNDNVLRQLQCSGALPDNPVTEDKLQLWSDAATALASAAGLSQMTTQASCWQGHHIRLVGSAWSGGDNLSMMHTGKQSGYRILSQFLTLLCFNAQGYASGLEAYYLNWSKQEYQLRVTRFNAISATQASALLAEFEQAYLRLCQAPLLYSVEAGMKLIKDAGKETWSDWLEGYGAQASWQSLWEGQRGQNNGLRHDPYMRWFYPDGLSLGQVPTEALYALFLPMVQGVKDSKL
ncbi:exodeoxyribonuclease V subunit gamma [Alteromonas aestuariivivens]|uniref:RecBCD enzyme subunit RecC n=1 Tax=Alteromonas aestuariivivens TaxID=1938339 RepID=A0A3D8M4D0_9ALTE|nr:exodeoxyribonuclease V subunit gamma [Alteromonas aestuariivivens]RDV24468.1 exodeoxyribonuclease V subunit gamma [Alteromonas aestuariivivens]